jgi:AsmA family
MLLMPRSHPISLLVITLSLLLVALGTFWLAWLPQRMVSHLKQKMLQENGLVLEAQAPQFGFDQGLVLSLDQVSLATPDGSRSSLTAEQIDVKVGFTTLFGASLSPEDLVLRKPVINLDVTTANLQLAGFVGSLTIVDGTLRLRDPSLKGDLALSDVNGVTTTSPNGAGKIDLRFIQNSVLSNLVVEVDNVAKLSDEGSPLDAALSAKGMIFSFSGRGRLHDGIGMDGTVLLEAQDAGSFLAWTGMPLKSFAEIGGLQGEAGISTEGLSAILNNLKLRVGSTEVTGMARLLTGPDRLSLVADVTADQLSIFAAPDAPPIFASAWSEVPWAWQDLSAAAANLKISTAALSVRGQNFGPATLTLVGDGITSHLVIDSKPPAAGAVHLSFEVITDATSRKLETDIDIKAAPAKTMLAGLFGFAAMDGLLDLKLKSTAVGDNTAALVSSLSGPVSLKLSHGSIAGVDLAARLTQPGDGWNATAVATTQNLSLSFDANLREGILSLVQADGSVDGIILKPKGETDLLRQAFDIVLAPRGKAVDATLMLKGLWVQPQFTSGQIKTAITPPAN